MIVTAETLPGSGGGSVGGAPAAPLDSSLAQQAKRLWSELSGLLHDQLRLAALETRQLLTRLAVLAGLAVAAAALFATAWLGVAAAGVCWLMALGYSAIASLLIAVVVSAALGCVLLLVLKGEARKLPFAGTLKSFRR